MNDLLVLSGRFETRAASGGGYPTLPPDAVVDVAKLERLAQDLSDVLRDWSGAGVIKDILVSVEYRRVVAKSNRLGLLLKDGDRAPEQSIVGARYEGIGTTTEHHVMTHYVSAQAIEQSTGVIEEAIRILNERFGGYVDRAKLEAIWTSDRNRDAWSKLVSKSLPRTSFAQIMRDAHFVVSFGPVRGAQATRERQIVTFYRTERTPQELLESFNIDVPPYNILDNSVLMSEAQYSALLEKAPYLVSMQCDDIAKMEPIELPDAEGDSSGTRSLPTPSGEPWIGVIDTPFDDVHPPYFSEWVEPISMLPDGVRPSSRDYEHGTFVTSLIVDAGGLNPQLEDGCGHFRVRHFGVATQAGHSSFEIIRKIERIVAENCDEIKVWNLSLGSVEEIDLNSISPEAAMLDTIQKRYGVLFVVAGTNDWAKRGARIGAPADSVNALVVNAVDFGGNAASYSRRGPAISFHRKPDVAYYGGDGDAHEYVWVCCGTGAYPITGTSFAAPLVARKAAYLINVMGISCEVAKALIIDSACGWGQPEEQDQKGYGIVPIRIEDVLQAKNDEIKVAISGIATEYEMYNYRLPVPVSKDTHPYVARATLCYFPECNRDQGVDYTCTELDLHFGRLRDNNIISLKKNTQGEVGDRTTESEARSIQRKWDNVKHVSEVLTERTRPRKAYGNPFWAIKLRKTSRFQAGSHEPQRFGLVITLKELAGVNRYDSFVQQCSALGWIVNRVELQTRVSIYEASQVEVEFE